MERIPFGIRRLDDTIGGGAPPGSVVMLSGEAGAGGREFMYTCAVMNALAKSDPALFDLYYGTEDERDVDLPEVHYISFTAEQRQVRREMTLAMDDEIVESAIPSISFHDLSSAFYRLSPVPREWYENRTASLPDLGQNSERSGVAGALGDRLTRYAPGNVVVVDSLTDLVTAPDDQLGWHDIPVLMKALSRAAYEWGGLILIHVNSDALSDTRYGQLVDAADGTLLFEWERGGSAIARTMVVSQFRGVLSRIEDENIVQFETEIGDAGFDISDVRKIR